MVLFVLGNIQVGLENTREEELTSSDETIGGQVSVCVCECVCVCGVRV